MKKTLTIMAGLVLASGLAIAQQAGPGPGEQNPDPPKAPPKDAPKAWSNHYSHSYAGQSAAGGGGQVQNRFGKTEVPADVQQMVKNFQQERTKLMNQLKTCSDEQRQLVLKEMEQLRTQLREQICHSTPASKPRQPGRGNTWNHNR